MKIGVSAAVRKFIMGFAVLAVVVIYLALGASYRPENIDDPWYLSFADNYVNHGELGDPVFGQDAAGESGIRLFGVTHAFVYGHVLNAVGWERTASYWLSSIFVLAGVFVWWLILAGRKWTNFERVVFSIGLLLVEPVFGAAHQARPDALIFMLVAVVLYLVKARLFVAAGLVTAVAFEIHPVGGVVGAYVLAWLLADLVEQAISWRSFIARGIWFSAGVLLGALYYVALHADALWQLSSGVSAASGGGGFNNALVEYFFHTRYLRHLPELGMMLAAVTLYLLRKCWRKDAFAGLAFALSIGFLIIIRRPNFMYVVFVYPAFMLLGIAALRGIVRLEYIILAMLVYLVPQYALVWMLNRDYDLDKYLGQIEPQVPADELAVVGAPNDWYAFRERHFYARCRTGGLAGTSLNDFYYIETTPAKYPASAALVRVIQAPFCKHLLTEFECNQRTFKVFRISLRDRSSELRDIQ